MRRTITVPALVFLLVSDVTAQVPRQDPDRIGTQLDWSTVQVEVYPTPKYGMRLWVHTTTESGLSQPHGLFSGFYPDSVLDWLNVADRVIHPSGGPADTGRVLVTPVLRSACGDSILILHRTNGRRWDRRVVVLFAATGSHPDRFSVLVDPGTASQLLAGLQREAMLSGVDPDSMTSSAARQDLTIDRPPELVRPGEVKYPGLPGMTGRVVMEFVIDSTGHPDPTTIHPLLAEHLIFVDPARHAIEHSLFSPASKQGVAIPVTVRQVFNFTP